MLVFAVVFKYINTISTPTHNNNTRFVKDINVTLPKLRTAFCQSGSYYVFTNLCLKQKICIHEFNNFIQLKIKHLSLDLNT
jgi:hypothetical protein